MHQIFQQYSQGETPPSYYDLETIPKISKEAEGKF